MHQIFYIDIDEEISSMIDRLNKSMSFDNYFVLPKRAIILQSAVNLKLLKREADKLGKRVCIVTADDNGMALAKRSEIEVLRSLEGIESESDSFSPKQDIFASEDHSDEITMKPEEKAMSHLKNSRLSVVGSSDFYGESPAQIKNTTSRVSKKTVLPAVKKPVQRTSIRQGMDMGVKKKDNFEPMNMGMQRERQIEKMFAPITPKEMEPKREAPKVVPIANGETSKIFFSFFVFSIFLLAGVAAYLFVPSAVVTVEPNLQTVKSDLSAHLGVNLSVADSTLPLKIIDKNEAITLQYDATGLSQASGQKAHGSVVISNSFSSSPQTLVATSRLKSENGKIFRLVKNVIVPGAVTVGGETKPGAITADVVADSAGSDYNIEPTNFTVPGFQGSPKYDKFSAKSSSAMIGGSLSGDIAGGQKILSQQDVDNAKAKTESALKQKITEEIRSTLGQGEILLDDAQKMTINKSESSAKVGDTLGSFDYTTSASVHALVFLEKDVRTLLQNATAKSNRPGSSKGEISKIEYGPTQSDFSVNTLDLQIHGETIFTPDIDLENLKKDVLGKDETQLAEVVKKNSAVKSLNVIFIPTFMTRVPEYSMRVTLEVQK